MRLQLLTVLTLLAVVASHPVRYLIGRPAPRNKPRAAGSTPSPSPTPSPKYGIVLDGPFIKLDDRIPISSCPQITTEYLDVIKTTTGHLRVPHSRIVTNGVRCGPLPDNATTQDLLADKYMELIPLSQLVDKDTADVHGVLGAYKKLTSKRPYTNAFFNYVKNDSKLAGGEPPTYVGYERYSDRVCGDVKLDIASLIFVGTVVKQPANLTNLLPRLQQGKISKGVSFQVGREYHVTFTPNGTDAEHVCPSVLSRPISFYPVPDVRKCFPGGMTVTSKRGSIDVADVQVGDWLHDGEDFSQVVLLTHRDHTTVSEFVEIRLGNGLVIQASRGHYVLSAHGLVTAEDIMPGMMLRTVKGVSSVSQVRIVTRRGLYNMQTASGKVVVGGVLASCYTTAIPPLVAHALLTPVRFVWELVGGLKKACAAVRSVSCPGMCRVLVPGLGIMLKGVS